MKYKESDHAKKGKREGGVKKYSILIQCLILGSFIVLMGVLFDPLMQQIIRMLLGM